MTKRILLAGVLGGLALFVWGAVSHMALGLGSVGMEYLPQQQLVMQAMNASVSQPGFYMFPRGDQKGNLPAERVGGAWGLVIYHPTGASSMLPEQLLNECLLNIVLALLAAYLLSLAPGLNGYRARVGFVVVLGTVVALMTHVQYWNWYGFPTSYTVANIVQNIAGFLVVGLVAAAFVKPYSARVVAMPARAA